MRTQRIVSTPQMAAAAILAAGLADRALAWLFGSEPVLAALATDGSAGGALLVWAFAHCDGIDGPVVTLAKKALEARNVNLVLPWVRREDEPVVRKAFGRALALRELGAEAKELAELHFFETLVRVHRAGEGEPYTGLKPAGRDLGPAIPAADRALETGSPEALVRLLADAVQQGVHERFHRVARLKAFDANDVAAGRRYVENYVAYLHYVEQLWQALRGAEPARHGAHSGEAHAAHLH